MTNTVRLQCPAKINLSLDVVNRRSDGYHNLRTIMHTINLFDTLEVSAQKSDTTHICIACDKPYVPTDSRNVCAKAANAFLTTLDMYAQIEISIKKQIPVGAGLGGGSSNAAGTLKVLNELFGFPLSDSQLTKLSATIGADIPFFIPGGCMLAEGIGEILTPLPPLKGVTFLIAKPDFGVSTPWAYNNLNLNQNTKHPDTETIIQAIKSNDIDLLSKHAGNLLEDVTIKEHPEISRYKELMKSCGASYSLMSGSGSSVFGVFTDSRQAKKAFEQFKDLTKLVYLA